MKDKEKKFTIETWLPLFPGFYNTYFSYWDEDNLFYDIFDNPDIIDLKYKDWLYDNIWDYLDYKEIEKKVALFCIEAINFQLMKTTFKFKFEYQNIYSPREYNFSNGSINVTLEISEKNIHKIIKTLEKNLKKFSSFLNERYSSYDGFISFHSTDYKEWIEDLKEYQNMDTHKIGSILEFILYKKKYTIKDLELEFFEEYFDIIVEDEKLISAFNKEFKTNINKMSDIETILNTKWVLEKELSHIVPMSFL